MSDPGTMYRRLVARWRYRLIVLLLVAYGAGVFYTVGYHNGFEKGYQSGLIDGAVRARKEQRP